MSATVRAATAADAEAIARHRVALFRTVLPPERRDRADAAHEPSLAALREMLADGSTLGWLAEDAGGAAVGSLVMHLVRRLPSPTSANGREGYVVHAYVDEAWRGRGVGARLLAEAEAAGRRLGLARIKLSATERAIPFYRRGGYTLRTNDMQRVLE